MGKDTDKNIEPIDGKFDDVIDSIITEGKKSKYLPHIRVKSILVQ